MCARSRLGLGRAVGSIDKSTRGKGPIGPKTSGSPRCPVYGPDHEDRVAPATGGVRSPTPTRMRAPDDRAGRIARVERWEAAVMGSTAIRALLRHMSYDSQAGWGSERQ